MKQFRSTYLLNKIPKKIDNIPSNINMLSPKPGVELVGLGVGTTMTIAGVGDIGVAATIVTIRVDVTEGVTLSLLGGIGGHTPTPVGLQRSVGQHMYSAVLEH
jgi:hypothetical protein